MAKGVMHSKGRACVAKGKRAWQRRGGCAWQEGMHGRRDLHGNGDVCAGETATEAGGTHPTGMHSCYFIIIIMYRMNKIENNPTVY